MPSWTVRGPEGGWVESAFLIPNQHCGLELPELDALRSRLRMDGAFQEREEREKPDDMNHFRSVFRCSRADDLKKQKNKKDWLQ